MKHLYRLSVMPAVALLMFFALNLSAFAQEASDNKAEPTPVTTVNPEIPLDELGFMLKPLSLEELSIEADGWFKLLQQAESDVAAAEVAVKRQNISIEDAQAIREKLADAKQSLEDVKDSTAAAREEGTVDAVRATQESTKEAQQNVQEVVDAVKKVQDEAAGSEEKKQGDSSVVKDSVLEKTDEAVDKAEKALGKIDEAARDMKKEGVEHVLEKASEAANEALDASKDASKSSEEAVEKTSKSEATAEDKSGETKDQGVDLDSVEQASQNIEKQKKDTKKQLLDHLTDLRAQRTEMIDRLNLVLDELEAKSGETDSAMTTKISQYRLYISSVQGINVDLKDASSTWAALKGWVTSEEGGMRWLVNLAQVAGILFVFYFLGRLAGKAVKKATDAMQNPSQLLQRFLVQSVRRLFFAAGILMALSALEVSVTPLLAMIGAAGLVVGLALQGTLSNFASGIMILFYRPFDVGDVIEAGGILGKVTAMNLVSTVITTPDNKRMIVPNNDIWGGVITNVSGVTRRRVDMQFGIGYEDDIDKAITILEEIVAAHPLVLEDPEPVIKLHELADSSVNFICRPWSLPGDYWNVYWDITREVKARFDKEGLSIPYPQQDVHIFTEGAIAAPVVAALPSNTQNPGELDDDAAIKSQPVKEIDVPEHE
ncbi:MAG: mechanosensitive ion channel [Pseudomonadota bacterium]|nr:mechanosensitive ion channel [Pseudomonadota bacterium]